MFEEGLIFLFYEKVLFKDEIVSFMELMVKFGIKKVCIIGGELLLRIDIVEIVCGLGVIFEIEDILIIMNVMYLVKKVEVLKDVGFICVNISLDFFYEDCFKVIIWGGCL